jgi:hypothetical protein
MILGFVFHKSKLLIIIDAIFMIITIGFRSVGIDLYVYLMEFVKSTEITVNQADFVGYYYLNLWAHNLGWSFQGFEFFVALLSVILLIVGMYRINKNNIPFAISFFLIYPFGHEASQVRTFLADSIILVAISFLVSTNENKLRKYINYLVYFCLCILASTIHTLAFFFIAIGIMYIFIPRKVNMKELILISVLSILLVKINLIPQIAESLMNTSKQDHWLDVRSGLGGYIPIIFTFIILGLSKFVINFDVVHTKDDKQRRLSQNIGRFCEYILFCLPLFIYDITFDRLWRNFLVILYLYSGNFLYMKLDVLNGKNLIKHNLNYEKTVFLIILFCTVFGLFIYENEWMVLNSFLIDNGFLSWLKGY